MWGFEWLYQNKIVQWRASVNMLFRFLFVQKTWYFGHHEPLYFSKNECNAWNSSTETHEHRDHNRVYGVLKTEQILRNKILKLLFKSSGMLDNEDEGTTPLRNVGNYL